MIFRTIIFLVFVAVTTACSVPTLESAACTDAKLVSKEFYSQHFAGDMITSADALNQKAKFLTPELVSTAAAAATGTDYFTTGDGDLPKAFRIGGCEQMASDRVRVEVLLFWRTDTRSEQRALNIELFNDSRGWKIDKIIR